MRWFLQGDAPEPWRRWFEGRPGAEPQERTDLYLSLDSTGLGVKIRNSGGSLEFKLREHDYGRRSFPAGPGAAGASPGGSAVAAVEAWQKWSLPQRRWGIPRRRLPWVEVNKVRRMVTYELNPAGNVAPTGGSPAEGCRVELTSLRVAGQAWCTVGFEAFGSDDRQLDALVATGNAVFAEVPAGHGLEAAVSCAYPEWLQMLP